MPEPTYTPRWDPDNQRFETPSRCPYPDCGQPVDAVHALESVLGWCGHCNRPFETTPFRPVAEAAALELHHRPDAAYSTYTGQLLTGRSVLDWAEAGGEPGRSYSQDDARGAVFGPPSQERTVGIAEDWLQHSILSSRGGDGDFVSSVSVVRGWLVAVTARGWVGIFDAVSGQPAPVRPLEWPTGSADPARPDRAVRQPPAFRGTQMVVAAPHEAQFRALKSFLFPGHGSPTRAPRMVAPAPGSQFLGPPLGVDGAARPIFCLLEGRENAGAGAIEEARLRFFDDGGEEIAECPAPEIARPPAFDRQHERIIWVDRYGALFTLASSELAAGARNRVASSTGPPDSILPVEVHLRPTFAVARNAQGSSEIWLSTALPEGGVAFHRTVLDEPPSRRPAGWRWQTKMLHGIGQVVGFAVGLGSLHHHNASGQLLAVATDRQVLALDRASLGHVGRSSMTGPEAVGTLGSYDVPVVCSAGVIARLQGSVCVEPQGLGWSEELGQPKVPVPGLYHTAQGIAMFGRRVYVGHEMGVRSFLVGIEERE